MKRRSAVVVIGLAGFVALGASPASALPPFTLAAKTKADPHPAQPTQIWRIRTGNQGGWDRVVFDQRFSPSGYTVRYVNKVYRDPSGLPVTMKGHASLQVSFPDSGTDGAAGAPTFIAGSTDYTLPEVKQVKKIGEFEAVVSFAIGLKDKHAFRVVTLTNPLRVAIDIKH